MSEVEASSADFESLEYDLDETSDENSVLEVATAGSMSGDIARNSHIYFISSDEE